MRQTSKLYLLALGLALGASSNSLAQHQCFTTIDFPGATFTNAERINPRGDIVGRYIGADGMEHGCLLSREERDDDKDGRGGDEEKDKDEDIE